MVEVSQVLGSHSKTVRTNCKWMIRSRSPFILFVWLSPYISVSIHLVPLFFQRLSLSVHPSLRHPLLTSSLRVAATWLLGCGFIGEGLSGLWQCVYVTGKKSGNQATESQLLMWSETSPSCDQDKLPAARLQCRETEGKLSVCSRTLGHVKSREQTDPLHADHSFSPGGLLRYMGIL